MGQYFGEVADCLGFRDVDDCHSRYDTARGCRLARTFCLRLADLGGGGFSVEEDEGGGLGGGAGGPGGGVGVAGGGARGARRGGGARGRRGAPAATRVAGARRAA